MNMPEINYGNFRKLWLRKATVYSFRNCSLILPVAEALVKQDYHFDPKISSKQGLLNLIPDLTTPIKVIPNGFNANFWKDLEKKRNPFSFISVATGTSNPARARVKGYDLIEQLAANHPDWTFTLAGDPNYISPNQNVKILGKQSNTELLELYNSHQFYLQLSTSEGFPNALGEAMACGCIPIGSAVGAIPEIIGKTELILKKKSISDLEHLLTHLDQDQLMNLSGNAVSRIHKHFSYSIRQTLLLHYLSV
ncbi:MAG: glycosyltransferase involved in cell wall biosynthesis [Algoriphagus sp.]|jgi:glycosyltransferase involved in cell wall biosynthesis